MSNFHSIIEIQVNGEWECVTDLRTDDDLVTAMNPPLFGKDRILGALFGAEADLELDPEAVVTALRGAPKHMSVLGDEWLGDHTWCEHVSYVHLSELIVHDWMQPVYQQGLCLLPDYWDFVEKDRSGIVHEDDIVPKTIPSFIQSPEARGKIIGEDKALRLLDAISNDVTWQSLTKRGQRMAYLKTVKIKQFQPLVSVQWMSPLYKAAGQLWSRAMPMMITKAGFQQTKLSNVRLTFTIE